MTEMEVLREQCMNCLACPLGKTRTKLVFGAGPVPSNIVFVGEGPGEQEDLSGEPFVGAAGKLLDEMLNIVDLGRHNCYICNIVKCRPPHNRDPQSEEQEACNGWLAAQMNLLQPKIVVCLGRIAAMKLIKPDFRITKEHGQWFHIDGIDYMAIYHPSALLRDLNRRPETFADLLELRKHAKQLQCMPYQTENV